MEQSRLGFTGNSRIGNFLSGGVSDFFSFFDRTIFPEHAFGDRCLEGTSHHSA